MIYRSSTDSTDEGWSNLSNAIILKAVEDYRLTNKQIKEEPEDLRLPSQKAEIEEFFLSAWFRVLTDLDGKQLLRRLQAETTQDEDVK